MPQITFATALRQVERLQRAADRLPWGDVDAKVSAWREVLAHPCARHVLFTADIRDELHQLHRSAGRYDEAIAAKRDAIADGYDSVPDPEADIAEMLIEAGRLDEGAALFATLRERAPDDVWLSNSAAWVYGRQQHHTESLRWALEGIDLALRTGDPDQVVMQLVELAEAAWTDLDVPHDKALIADVEGFVAAWTRPRRSGFDPTPLPEEPACDHCGYDPDEPLTELVRPPSRPPRPEAPRNLAFAWFPAAEWAQVAERWADVAEERGTDHLEYSHQTEARIKMIAATMPGQAVSVAPLSITLLEEWAAQEGTDPGSAETRTTLAAELARRGDTVPWPPSRNAPCWCGSVRKYKKCCGPVPAHRREG